MHHLLRALFQKWQILCHIRFTNKLFCTAVKIFTYDFIVCISTHSVPNLRLHDPIPAQVGAGQSPPPPCMYYILLFAAKLRDCLMRIKVCIVLPYFNQKLFSRADVAHHKILILLKGNFTIYKVQSSLAIPDCLNDFRCRKNVCLAYSLSGDILKGQCNEIFECWFF